MWAMVGQEFGGGSQLYARQKFKSIVWERDDDRRAVRKANDARRTRDVSKQLVHARKMGNEMATR
jgi:hypothetical protein